MWEAHSLREAELKSGSLPRNAGGLTGMIVDIFSICPKNTFTHLDMIFIHVFYTDQCDTFFRLLLLILQLKY